jgi:O-antigen/teichoic acid export membrane protein
VTLFVGLILAGMLARYFSPDEFGLWSILISLNGVLLTGFDFGFGNALRNRMAQLYASRNDGENRVCYLAVFYWFLFSAFVLSTIFFSIRPHIPWELLFKTTDPYILETGATLIVLGASILAFNIAFNLYTVGFYSYQESHWNALVNGAARLLLLLCAVGFVLSLQSFFVINVMTFLVTLLSSVAAFMIFLAVRKWPLTRIPLGAIWTRIRELWIKSAQFALLQLISTFLLMTDLFVVSNLLGLEVVGEYFLVKRLYLVLASFHFAVLLPLWSAYTESIESHDTEWAERSLKKAAALTVVVFTAGVIVLCLVGSDLIYWWTGKRVVHASLFIWLGIWGFLYGWGNCFSVFLNAVGRLNVQVLLGGLAAVAFIPLSLWLGKSHGIIGICLALILISVPFAIFAPLEAIRVLRSAAGRSR